MCALLQCIRIEFFPLTTISYVHICVRAHVCVPLLTRPCMRMWVCVDVDSPTRMYWNCITANSNRCVHAILFCTHRCSSSISCQLYWKFEGTHKHGAHFAQVPSESCVCVCLYAAAQLEPFMQTANSWNVQRTKTTHTRICTQHDYCCWPIAMHALAFFFIIFIENKKLFLPSFL